MNKDLTIEAALKLLPEPARGRALKNCYPNMLHKAIQNTEDALICAFYWQDTPEGFDYWRQVAFNEQKKAALKNNQ